MSSTYDIIWHTIELVKKLLDKMSAIHDKADKGKEDDNMQMTLVGVQEIQFTNDSGKEIRGKNVFCAFNDENVDGVRTEKFFLKEGIPLPKDIQLNDIIDVAFNMKGKVEKISKAD